MSEKSVDGSLWPRGVNAFSHSWRLNATTSTSPCRSIASPAERVHSMERPRSSLDRRSREGGDEAAASSPPSRYAYLSIQVDRIWMPVSHTSALLLNAPISRMPRTHGCRKEKLFPPTKGKRYTISRSRS